jgi:hypothetical protein
MGYRYHLRHLSRWQGFECSPSFGGNTRIVLQLSWYFCWKTNYEQFKKSGKNAPTYRGRNKDEDEADQYRVPHPEGNGWRVGELSYNGRLIQQQTFTVG